MVKVLIVDDSRLALMLHAQILEDAGHQVVDAEDGLLALEQYFFEKPNLVLLDVTMKEMDGIEVLKRLRELDPSAAVIIVTADIQDTTRQMARDGGASGFVMKPVGSIALLSAIEQVLQGGASCN